MATSSGRPARNSRKEVLKFKEDSEILLIGLQKFLRMEDTVSEMIFDTETLLANMLATWQA